MPGGLSIDDFTPLSWEEAYIRAAETLAKMTQAQKATLMQGVGWKYYEPEYKWWYTGVSPGIPSLNIPSLKFQDSPAGFRLMYREMHGTVVCWPSLLAVAATWSPELSHALGVALGKEFSGKGANAILGPLVEVHRVAQGGRNFESISGEDPYLGSRLASQYIHGVHSQGICAVVKHFVLNSQETHRNSFSSEIDAKTMWELYYPPFQAAVDAGVCAVMCAYNRVNGTFSCENQDLLERDLRGIMGFQGFVQSDWWATHSTKVEKGLDQEMPGNDGWYTPERLICPFGADRLIMVTLVVLACVSVFLPPLFLFSSRVRLLKNEILSRILCCYGDSSWPRICTMAGLLVLLAMACAALDVNLFSSVCFCASSPSGAALDAAAKRILAVMHRMDLFTRNKCNPPCPELLLSNVTTAEHVALARTIAAESIVVLKNEQVDGTPVLPIQYTSKVKSIAILGSVADAQPLWAGGSGGGLDWWGNFFLIATVAIVIILSLSFVIHSLRSHLSVPRRICLFMCVVVVLAVLVTMYVNHVASLAGTWARGDYYSGGGSGHMTAEHIATPREAITERAEAAGISVTFLASGMDDPSEAVAISRDADLVIVLAGTTSGEDSDRTHLHLDNDADRLIQIVSAQMKRVVVCMQIPGAVVVPWHHSVSGIAAMFLGGQATGPAWADVLFGDQGPSGRLPVTLLETEEGVITPSANDKVLYAEGLATGYRSPLLHKSFAFGHGLAYTTFHYSSLATRLCSPRRTLWTLCVQVDVSNSGLAPGRTVSQLYLKFPESARQPQPVLKGFFKTQVISPGGSVLVTFRLGIHDVSYYDSGQWMRADTATILVGESSADIRQSSNLALFEFWPAHPETQTKMQTIRAPTRNPAPDVFVRVGNGWCLDKVGARIGLASTSWTVARVGSDGDAQLCEQRCKNQGSTCVGYMTRDESECALFLRFYNISGVESDPRYSCWQKASCGDYLLGCNWTKQWNCPNQSPGRMGAAENDFSLAYRCCCEQNLWQEVDSRGGQHIFPFLLMASVVSVQLVLGVGMASFLWKREAALRFRQAESVVKESEMPVLSPWAERQDREGLSSSFGSLSLGFPYYNT